MENSNNNNGHFCVVFCCHNYYEHLILQGAHRSLKVTYNIPHAGHRVFQQTTNGQLSSSSSHTQTHAERERQRETQRERETIAIPPLGMYSGNVTTMTKQ